jgi:hypothetical protein
MTEGGNEDAPASVVVEPDDSVERAELEAWLAELPEGELLVDSWEQPIPQTLRGDASRITGKPRIHWGQSLYGQNQYDYPMQATKGRSINARTEGFQQKNQSTASVC